jgi:hypothetical protein
MKAMNWFFGRVAVFLLVSLLIVYWLSTLTNKNITRINIDASVFVQNAIETIGNIPRTSTTTVTALITQSTTTRNEDATLEERSPAFSWQNTQISNGSVAVFVFHTSRSILAKIQLHLIRKLAINLVGLELFVDGVEPEGMRNATDLYNARLHILPDILNSEARGPSYRNANLVNWALSMVAKDYLANGTAVLLLDGDVIPLSFFSSRTLLNSRDIVCRRYPGPLSRYCWIGFITLSPQLFPTIDDFNVSPVLRYSQVYDAGGRTIEYLLKYRNASFSWAKETIFYKTNQTLFWGALNTDIRWIKSHFDKCDKCGPEIFLSGDGNGIFYHMISASSHWRFSDLEERLQALYDSLMRSPYGQGEQLSVSQLTTFVEEVHKMDMVPLHGNLSCSRICSG